MHQHPNTQQEDPTDNERTDPALVERLLQELAEARQMIGHIETQLTFVVNEPKAREYHEEERQSDTDLSVEDESPSGLIRPLWAETAPESALSLASETTHAVDVSRLADDTSMDDPQQRFSQILDHLLGGEEPEALTAQVLRHEQYQPAQDISAGNEHDGGFFLPPSPIPDWKDAHARLEKWLLARTLDATHGNMAAAARILGITKVAVLHAVRRHGLTALTKAGAKY